MIVVEAFSKQYGALRAVDGLSFAAPPGCILGLIGPNGAGKTTTLRALAGVLAPSAGSLQIAGFDVAQAPLEAKRRLAYVPDEPPHFSDLTVREHLMFHAAVFAVDDAERKAAELLAFFQLTAKSHALARDLSRGMRQKLALCCAYLHDPLAILLDEPMTGLDPPGIRRLKDSLAARAAEGAAVIVSSHLLAMVEDICTDVLILDHGSKAFIGPIRELRARFGEAGREKSLEDIFFEVTS